MNIPKTINAETIKTLGVSALIGVLVTLVYVVFEHLTSHSIALIWEHWFNTAEHRLLVIPVCLVLSLLYFKVQHRLAPQREHIEDTGLGHVQFQPNLINFAKVLTIGFFSLLAGASLGVEAILLPAAIVLGSMVGMQLMGAGNTTRNEPTELTGSPANNTPNPATNAPQYNNAFFATLGLVALFTSFFSSFVVGLLGLLMAKKQFKLTLNAPLVGAALVSAASSALVLSLLKSPAFVRTPDISWALDVRSLLILVLLALAGYAMTIVLNRIHTQCERVSAKVQFKPWWQRALVAGAGLSALYLIGGELVQFTGNESIVPLLHSASDLGFLGLAWLFIIKLVAIAWSKALGYQGGLIFPTVFAASALVAMAQLLPTDTNFFYGLIAVMVGAFVSDAKQKILL